MEQAALNRKWMFPQWVSGLDVMMGITGSKIDEYLPKWDEIPIEFRREVGDTRKWIEIVSTWFFEGGNYTWKFTAKENIDKEAAVKHLTAVLKSFEPQHERKTAGVAWLMSLWFINIVYERKKSK